MTTPKTRPSPFDKSFPRDPYPLLAGYREQCPVTQVLTPRGRPVWIFTRDADVRAALTDTRLSTQGDRDHSGPRRRTLDVSLVMYDPPHHTTIKRLATPWFTPQRVEKYRPVAEAVAARLLEPLASRPVVDLMTDFAHPFSFQVMCELFDLDHAVRGELYTWVASVFPMLDREAADANMDGLDAFFQDLTRRRLEAPGDDVLSAILRAWDPASGVEEREVVSLGASLLLAAYETTAQVIGMSIRDLLTRPDDLATLRACPHAVPNAVDELLRYHPPGPFATLRYATEDIHMGDDVIPAGSRVLLSIAAANRDPERYPDPDRFDLNRSGAAKHVTFGLGPHYCPGAPLARMELGVAISAVLGRFPGVALVPGPTHWRGNILSRGLSKLLVNPEPLR